MKDFDNSIGKNLSNICGFKAETPEQHSISVSYAHNFLSMTDSQEVTGFPRIFELGKRAIRVVEPRDIGEPQLGSTNAFTVRGETLDGLKAYAVVRRRSMVRQLLDRLRNQDGKLEVRLSLHEPLD